MVRAPPPAWLPPSQGADEGQGVEGGAGQPWEKRESVKLWSSTKLGPWTLNSAVHRAGAPGRRGALFPEKHTCGLGPGWKVELSHQAGTGIRSVGTQDDGSPHRGEKSLMLTQGSWTP